MNNKENKIIKQHLEYMLISAFDFLEFSAENFENKPKYSIIHYASAIELFLKSRLYEEHWSLIMDKPNIQHLKQNNFHTIGFSNLIEQYKNVFNVNDKEVKNALQCFHSIAQDRNQAVHFYHKNIELNSDDEKITIATKQLRAWNYLKLFLQNWEPVLGKYIKDYTDKIVQCDNLLQSHSKYLEIKYNSIKDTINDKIKNGANYVKCENCGYKAVNLKQKESINLYSGVCEVCNFDKNYALKIKCPYDNTEFTIFKNDLINENIICPNCHNKLGYEDLFNISDNLSDEKINCNSCLSDDCVIKQKNLNTYKKYYDSVYICLKCLEVTNSENYCQYCNQSQIGNKSLDNSYFMGCDWCEGLLLRDLQTGEYGIM